jgi:cation diffusion facilitator CzcD-associated flavoprotein CzcO
MSHTETAIVGAGPYGLSLAAHLRHRGLSFEMFGRPMQSWAEFMPKGMLLKSEGFASNLWDPQRAYTLEAFCAERGIAYRPTAQPVPLDVFLDYTAWFQHKAGIVCNGLYVDRLERDDRGFYHLTASDGRRSTARRVVIASGHMPFLHVPEALRSLPRHILAHTSELCDLSGYAGRDVTVIGAGQAALETAALLAENGATVRLVCRRDIVWNPPAQPRRTLRQRLRAPESGLAPGWRSLFYSEMPGLVRYIPVETRHRIVATKWGPAGTAWLYDRVNGKVDLLTHRSVVSAQTIGDRARLVLSGPNGGESIETDAVVTGTGFKAEIDRLTMLDAGLRSQIVRENGATRLSGVFETSVPNLHLLGILTAPTFGPVMRFMFGAKYAAPTLARVIAARTRATIRTPVRIGLGRAHRRADATS